MRTRNSLFVLYLVLIGVPVAAAAYIGTAGVQRERDMLVDREYAALEQRADDIRAKLVQELQKLWREENLRPCTEYRPIRVQQSGVRGLAMTGIVTNDPAAAVHDYFQATSAGVELPWGGAAQVTPDMAALVRDESLRALGTPTSSWLVPAVEVDSWFGETPKGGPDVRVLATDLVFRGDLAVRRLATTRDRWLIQGFRIDVARLERRFLDPASPDCVYPRFDERVERVRIRRDDARLRIAAAGAFDLPTELYRSILPAARRDDPVLMPPGYDLVVAVRPSGTLASDLDKTSTRLKWTLGGVLAIVVLGLLFLWRALRAEERLAERKAEFVNAVSHELRTPLTSIRMYADMLKEGWAADENTKRDYYGLISAESERLARLVNNVLDFSRIEKGKKEFEMQVGDPASVVRDVADVLRPYLEEKGFTLNVELPNRLPACRFDKDALTQILVNLIDNAVKYGEREVRLEAEEKDGHVILRVLDRGPGVPADERERIFVPFQRGAHATNSGGSGLGLALVRHFAVAHNGQVAVGDRDGGGAVFALQLPAA